MADSFNHHRAPAAVRWWMQRFIDRFIVQTAAAIECQPKANGSSIWYCELVGMMAHAFDLTDAQRQGLVAVLSGQTPAQFLEHLAAHEASLKWDPTKDGPNWCARCQLPFVGMHGTGSANCRCSKVGQP